LRRHSRRSHTVLISSAALVRAATGPPGWMRRIPIALFVLGVGVAAIAVARPQATVTVASDNTTIILAIDTSGSMCSTDVDPNRLSAAQASATTFINAQTGGARIGLVAFASNAGLVVPPTTDKNQLVAAIGTLTTSRGTAIGQAILVSIDAIAEVDPSIPGTGAPAPADPLPAPALIIVLTDGANTQGVSPDDAAAVAAARGIPVDTIGFGTRHPAQLVCQPSQVGGMGRGDFGGRGGGFGGRDGLGRPGGPLVADYPALQAVADATGGQFYPAQDAAQLTSALGDIPQHLTTVTRNEDLAVWFAAGAGILVAAAVGLALWFQRPRHQPRVV
jgi:Ca-activated chloride channel family protein